MIPATPPDESKRMNALRSLCLLDTSADARYDRVTLLAQRTFAVPIALINLVDENRVWSKSNQGLGATESPRATSFCGHTILSDEPLIVCNATKDPRFADNPFVTGEPYVRFYAGWPLKGPDGSRVGTLCLVDMQAREFTTEHRRALRDMAEIIQELLRTAP